MARILITGGAGFIGSNFVRYWRKAHPRDSVTVLDLLTYAGSRKAAEDLRGPNVRFIRGDVADPRAVGAAMRGCRTVFHFAAETHVDRSIHDSGRFVRTNVLGTQRLLESARLSGIERFVMISTDEVYGSVAKGSAGEDARLAPNSPYAASKAAADLLCRSYVRTHGTPVVITRCCNNYGPRQFPEKVIPLFITNLLQGLPVPVYGDGRNVREWIHVDDHARAVDLASRKGRPGEIYNIGTGRRLSNLELAGMLLKAAGAGRESLRFVKDRPGHDLRYALDSSKIRGLGWRPRIGLREGLMETVAWYGKNRAWWRGIKSGPKYRSYVARQYR